MSRSPGIQEDPQFFLCSKPVPGLSVGGCLEPEVFSEPSEESVNETRNIPFLERSVSQITASRRCPKVGSAHQVDLAVLASPSDDKMAGELISSPGCYNGSNFESYDSWSNLEMDLFEEGFNCVGVLKSEILSLGLPKNRLYNKFGWLQKRYLPHKTVAEIISFYYHWKVTPCREQESSEGFLLEGDEMFQQDSLIDESYLDSWDFGFTDLCSYPQLKRQRCDDLNFED